MWCSVNRHMGRQFYRYMQRFLVRHLSDSILQGFFSSRSASWPGSGKGQCRKACPCLLLRPIPPRLRPSVAAMARSRRPSRHPLRAKVPCCRLGANRTAPCCATPNAPCPATVTRPTHGRKASRAHAPGPGTGLQPACPAPRRSRPADDPIFYHL